MTSKRKRPEIDPVSSPAHDVVVVNIRPDGRDRKEDSPRTKVAKRFQGLELDSRPSQSPTPSASPSRMGASKRQKRDNGLAHLDLESSGLGIRLDNPFGTPRSHARVDEVAETPGYGTQLPSSPPLSPDRPPRRKRNVSPRPPARPLSPPPPTPLTSPPDSSTHTSSVARSVSPLQLSAALAATDAAGSVSPPQPRSSDSSSKRTAEPTILDPSALTWQISEITGHLLDPESVDDDGEGINGVGFKPTAAMARARAMKRRKQVSEWKAREARDARQRRFEKRRTGSGGSSGSGSGSGGRSGGVVKKGVRFADG